MENPMRIVSLLPSATEMICALGLGPQLLGITHCCDYPPEIHANLRELGGATGREKEAEALIQKGSARLLAVTERIQRAQRRPRIFCAEWVDPLYCSGHWVPEMVEIAGGVDVLGRKWADSVRVTWDSLVDAAPELIVVMSCGFDRASTAQHAQWLLRQPGADGIPAVRHNRVYAVDAGYFSRPGPRVIDGTELLAHLIHPDLSAWQGPLDAFQRIDCDSRSGV